ncbi:hypothetical protein MOX02_20810 [Methylobacterium oxalidis]|uniref:PilZ domain-containing protein n=2 Tax=Methylobacterium oxalidis TaxID=944322 RepID=A0A512J2A7_9HYPH|nr:hypothetical protein MOX02_20810 [Methylobacterium oxalidis]GJE34832.1 hypothetical protein LDDCCGHA_5047 [Methylobacterium oxalidis]GLS64074.1 hypothetical protein GCM10007888_24550 [Methylobacterium oxalidis]
MPTGSRPKIDVVSRRESERLPVALTAFAVGGDGTKFSCSICDVSDTGAMLEFGETGVVMLPPKFEIALANSEARFSAKMVWREGRRAGVLFCL